MLPSIGNTWAPRLDSNKRKLLTDYSMDPYIILAKTEQGAWIETKEIGTSQWSKQEQLILVQGEDSKKGQLIYLTRKGSFLVILYKMIRFLSGKLKKHTKLAKIVKIGEIFNRLVFPLNFNRFCHPMTLYLFVGKFQKSTEWFLKRFFPEIKVESSRHFVSSSSGNSVFLFLRMVENC